MTHAEQDARIEKVIEYMRAESRRINMGTWGEKVEKGEILDKYPYGLLGRQRPPCNTVCCFAGATCIVLGTPVWDVWTIGISFLTDAFAYASKLLELSLEDASSLFLLKEMTKTDHHWPTSFEWDLSRATGGTPEYVEIVVSRIRHWQQYERKPEVN